MKSITVLLSILSGFVIVTGCGKSGGGSGGNPIVLPERIVSPPAVYLLDDEACQKQKDRVDLTAGIIPAWQADAVNMINVDLTGTFSSVSLRNAAVRDTVYGVEYQRKCDASKPKGKECFDKFGREIDYDTLEGKGWYLRLCNDNYPYARKSVETVALTSAHYLDVAHKKYLSLKDQSAEVPPQLLLNVLPIFTDIHENYFENGKQKIRKEHIVHNLAYYGSKNMIIVFPESVERDRTLPGYFWESQFVLGHEYGHHVERLRTGLLVDHLGIDWNPVTHSWEDQGRLTAGGSGATEFTQMLGTVSEGFADLLAFYAEGGTSFSLTGIPGLGPNRDIRSSSFANSDEKILTTSRFSLLTGRTQPGDRDPDRKYTDIHVAGAVLAYAADQIFKTVSLARAGVEEGAAADIDYRYKLLLRWIDHTGEGLALVKEDKAERQLEKISEAFAVTVKNATSDFQLRPDTNDEEIRRSVCQVLTDVVPALSVPAFSLDGGGC